MVVCSSQVILGACKFIIQQDVSYFGHKNGEDLTCIQIYQLKSRCGKKMQDVVNTYCFIAL